MRHLSSILFISSVYMVDTRVSFRGYRRLTRVFGSEYITSREELAYLAGNNHRAQGGDYLPQICKFCPERSTLRYQSPELTVYKLIMIYLHVLRVKHEYYKSYLADHFSKSPYPTVRSRLSFGKYRIVFINWVTRCSPNPTKLNSIINTNFTPFKVAFRHCRRWLLITNVYVMTSLLRWIWNALPRTRKRMCNRL